MLSPSQSPSGAEREPSTSGFQSGLLKLAVSKPPPKTLCWLHFARDSSQLNVAPGGFSSALLLPGP